MKTITINRLQPKGRKNTGPSSYVERNEYNAEVVPGRSIRLFGKALVRMESTGRHFLHVIGGFGLSEQSEEIQGARAAIARMKALDVETICCLLMAKAPEGVIRDAIEEAGGLPVVDMLLKRGLLIVNMIHEPIYEAIDRTFEIGDEAEYSSFNLTYTGRIVSITEKTVTIDDDGKVTRLDLYKFAWRNHDFNAERVRRENHEMAMTL